MTPAEALWRTGLATSEKALITYLRATQPDAIVQVGRDVRVDLGALVGEAVEGELPVLQVLETGTLP